jgi:hypothetical protein
MNKYTACQGEEMENRWSDRRDLTLGVDVIHHGEKLLTCNSRDVGLGGTCLDVDKEAQVRLKKDSDVELVFHLKEGQQETRHTLHARVVRIDPNGIGLKFNEFDTGVFRSLQEIMGYHGADRIH